MTTDKHEELVKRRDELQTYEIVGYSCGDDALVHGDEHEKALKLIEDLLTSNADLLAENARIKAAMEWRDIESAPKDGSAFLVYHGGYISVASYHRGFDEFLPDDAEENMLTGEPDSRFSSSPTHWMPLPTPPEKQGEA